MSETENTTTESSPVETTEAETTETTEASAETETTEGESTEEPRIPKSRLDEVIAQRNEEREKIAELERKLAEKNKPEAATETVTPTAGEDPPAGLSERDLIRWYVEKDSDAMIRRELGMDLKTAATLLGATKETTQDYAKRQWSSLCEPHGLDPENEDVQFYFMAATKNGGLSNEDALKRAASAFNKKGSDGKTKEPATVDTGGVTGVMTSSKPTAKNAKEAAELAAKGIRAVHQSQDEIFAARKAREARATKGG